MTALQASWAEKTLESMTLDEKIGQLFIVPACPLRDDGHLADIKNMITQYHIGGVILKQADPEKQVTLINTLQNQSGLPLLCVMDAEWGLGMRMQNMISFPKNLTLGAIQNKEMLHTLGKEIGRQCKKVGGHVNLAPVVDVNSNPYNPIIHMRSFGESPDRVAECAVSLMQGMQEAGILACAKHFPGHGDTIVDSHVDLPVVSHSLERLERVEFYPFQKMIQAGVDSVMTGHLFVPSCESKQGCPATLSAKITTDLLKNKLGFEGVVFTDALNMKALTNHFSTGEIALNALRAGNDFLVYGDHIAPNIDRILQIDVPEAIHGIKKAYEEGTISKAELDGHVLKILKLKERLHLPENRETVASTNLLEDLNSASARSLKKELFRQAITLVRNKKNLLPLAEKNRKKIALVQMKDDGAFASLLKRDGDVNTFSFSKGAVLIRKLKHFSLVIFSVNAVSANQKDFGIPEEAEDLIQKLNYLRIPVILTIFGTPYALSQFEVNPTVIMAYEDDIDAYEAAADLIFGKLVPTGKLPVRYADGD
ncbi:MAG TPA: glycoside hydrolase family 3 N-terminal domain-containing protein [Rhabdochlamydiaceae bacterium]|nr:glycoside hydrolase family 3 N-terminal domain-containing protein [Rhabdochlamydiaceae bacterium]